MIRSVLMMGNDDLRQRCASVSCFDAALQTSTDLHDTLVDLRRNYGFGRGLAAPQIGALLRVVVLIWPSELVLINPEIVEAHGSQVVWDDCFSIPGLMMRVERARTVVVKYQDPRGAWQQLSCRDATAELLQHELDHLDGVLAIDQVRERSDLMIRTEWERQRGLGLIST